MVPSLYARVREGTAVMRVKFSRTIPETLHGELRDILELAARKVNTKGVEFHVKRSGDEYFKGYAYDGIPYVSSVAATTDFLVTIRVPLPLESIQYPRTWRYPGMKTAPEFRYQGWTDEFFHLIAHECYHIKQFRSGYSRSEVKAERWAWKRMEEEGLMPYYDGGAETVA